MTKEELLAELIQQNNKLQALLSKFIKSDMLGYYLPNEYEARFKRITLEIRDLLDDYFGNNNKYSIEISSTIIHKTGGFIPGISYAGVTEIIAIVEAAISRIPKQEPINNNNPFIEQSRIQELKALNNESFDMSKLIRLLEELNLNYSNKCYLSCAMICRAILDHIPPLFGFNTFQEVANNYGGKSIKGNAQHLQNSLRNIADNYLHQPIRNKETLPNQSQINFTNDLDVILAEIIRILK